MYTTIVGYTWEKSERFPNEKEGRSRRISYGSEYYVVYQDHHDRPSHIVQTFKEVSH